jgi:hypothetical protein
MDTFELHLPRLQMSRTGADSKDKARHPLSSDSDSPNHGAMLLEEDRIQLRREIKLFWEGVSDYLDKIVRVFISQFIPASTLTFDDAHMLGRNTERSRW